MSWSESDGEPPEDWPGPEEPTEDWPGPDGPIEDWPGPEEHRWPLVWQGLYPRERWMWFEQLWTDVCKLRERYHLALRSGWWTDQIQLEGLAAMASWVARYDSGEWDDPPGKLALLYDLERLGTLLRDGREPFAPERDRAAFVAHLLELGCQPPSA